MTTDRITTAETIYSAEDKMTAVYHTAAAGHVEQMATVYLHRVYGQMRVRISWPSWGQMSGEFAAAFAAALAVAQQVAARYEAEADAFHLTT